MKNPTPAALLALTVAFAVPAQAQLYAGGAVGQSRAKLDAGDRSNQLLGLGFDGASSRADDRDTAYRLFVGYRLHRFLASELGYTDLGQFGVVSNVIPAGTLEGRTRVNGAELSLLGLLPVGERVTAYVRGGVFEARTRTSYSGSGSVRILDGASATQHKASGLYGVGAMVQLMPRWDLRADWTTYRHLRDDSIASRFDARAWTFGVAYHF